MPSDPPRYQDPLELLWTATAKALGFEVARSETVFASWNGKGTLSIGVNASLDTDDSLAQLVFHEICHALVEGPEAHPLVDWGLDSENAAHGIREHACLRLQAALADRHGLRVFFAPTTEFRSFYEALPADPLGAEEQPEVPAARAAWKRAREGPWAEPLERALAATAALRSVILPFADVDSLWRV